MKTKILMTSFMLLGLLGCEGKAQKRTYQEIVIESPLKAAWQGSGDPHASLKSAGTDALMSTVQDQELLNSSADTPLDWQTPVGWQELPGSGFRLVTFKSGEGDTAIDCSIVSLSGAAGGIEANLMRWMGQIGLQAPDEGLIDFLKKSGAYVPEHAKANGIPIHGVDFTPLQKNLPDTTPSMYVNIMETPQATIFIKMTGSIDALAKNKKKFESLSRSMTIKE